MEFIQTELHRWRDDCNPEERERRGAAVRRILYAFEANTEKLNLSYLGLTSLPNVIGRLTALQQLWLDGNWLVSLPEGIGQLRALQELWLNNNQFLTSLPNGILSLPSTCKIDLTGCSLSATVRNHLRAETNTGGYQGPRISYSIPATPIVSSSQTVEELLRQLFVNAKTKYCTLNALIVNENNKINITLKSWLFRLSYMSDYNSSSPIKQWLCGNVVKYLKLANEDPTFRGQFFAIICDASETCGDRAALSILHLGVAYKLASIDLKDIKNLAEFLKNGVWAITLLQDCAAAKISQLKFFDEIEVYLAYPVRLKAELNLPIDVDEMLYFTCSSLDKNDLNSAAEFVKTTLGNEEAFCKFLIQNDKWKEALALHFPDDYNSLVTTKNKSNETVSKMDDHTLIQTTYEEGLVLLTKRALFETNAVS